MLTTYEAILKGNHIEWRDEVPERAVAGEAVAVHITLLDEQTSVKHENGQRMADALSKLAQTKSMDGADARNWQREIRLDNPLIGRND